MAALPQVLTLDESARSLGHPGTTPTLGDILEAQAEARVIDLTRFARGDFQPHGLPTHGGLSRASLGHCRCRFVNGEGIAFPIARCVNPAY
jgi:hypothetical protein